MSKSMLGIQLYTVRQDASKDFKGTLSALAAMGYQGVEFAGVYGGMEPAELAVFLKGIGLATAGIHTSVEEISDPASGTYAYAEALGARYVTTGLPRDVAKDWDAAIARITLAGQAAASKGLQFTYHNHDQEFAKIDGQYALDILYHKTEPRVVQCELDVYWIRKGGADPVAYVKKYAGRTPQVHLKDMDPADGSFAEVGSGTIDMKAVWAAGVAGGAEWMIVEQDSSKRTPMESAKISIDNIRKMGLS